MVKPARSQYNRLNPHQGFNAERGAYGKAWCADGCSHIRDLGDYQGRCAWNKYNCLWYEMKDHLS